MMKKMSFGKKAAGILLGAMIFSCSVCTAVTPAAQSIGHGASKVNSTVSQNEPGAPVQSTAAPGWVKNGGRWYFYGQDGTLFTDGITPDGYYTDGNGSWAHETKNFIGLNMYIADKFLMPSEIRFAMSAFLDAGTVIYEQVKLKLPGLRSIHYYPNSIEYCRVDNSKETVILGLYADKKQNVWQLKVAGNLGNRDGNYRNASTCDYEVLRFLLSRLSHSPDLLADAIYQSWQAGNTWKLNMNTPVSVGDARLTVDLEQGAAIYTITRRAQ